MLYYFIRRNYFRVILNSLQFLFSFRFLIIGTTGSDEIVQYNVETKVVDVLLEGNDNAPQDISVDGENEVVYWVNFINNEHKLMSTSYENITTDLGITTDGPMRIDQDQLMLYVLNPSNDMIVQYNKSTWEIVGSFNVPASTDGVEVALGECGQWLNIS